MRARLMILLRALRASYWFLPSLMLAGALGLVVVATSLDRWLDLWFPVAPGWITTYSVENARSVLTTIGASMVTLAGVSFSIVIVALTVASSQFGPMLLAGFMRDRGNQVTLGTFTATFLYCLLALRHVRQFDQSGQAPPILVLTAVLLAIASLSVFTYFIHHVSTSIQADEIVAEAGRELQRRVRTRAEISESPQPEGDHDWLPEADDDPALLATRVELKAHKTGYLSEIVGQELADLAEAADVAIVLEAQEGDFLVAGSPIGYLLPGEGSDLERVLTRISGQLQIVYQRGSSVDLMLAIDRLVGVAVRALSPGINDPYTALVCIDRLEEVLTRLAAAPEARRLWVKDGKALLRLRPLTFEQILARAFEPILHYGKGDPRVTRRLQSLLDSLVRNATRPEPLAALDAQRARLRRAEEGQSEPV